jgi:hypothetical protein
MSKKICLIICLALLTDLAIDRPVVAVPTDSPTNDSNWESMARRYRIAVFQRFGGDRKKYDRWIDHLQMAEIQSRLPKTTPEQKARLTLWLKEATNLARTNSAAGVPQLPLGSEEGEQLKRPTPEAAPIKPDHKIIAPVVIKKEPPKQKPPASKPTIKKHQPLVEPKTVAKDEPKLQPVQKQQPKPEPKTKPAQKQEPKQAPVLKPAPVVKQEPKVEPKPTPTPTPKLAKKPAPKPIETKPAPAEPPLVKLDKPKSARLKDQPPTTTNSAATADLPKKTKPIVLNLPELADQVDRFNADLKKLTDTINQASPDKFDELRPIVERYESLCQRKTDIESFLDLLDPQEQKNIGNLDSLNGASEKLSQLLQSNRKRQLDKKSGSQISPVGTPNAKAELEQIDKWLRQLKNDKSTQL